MLRVIKNIAIGLSLSLIGALGALLIAELGFRLLGRPQPSGSLWSDRPTFYYRHEAAQDCRGSYYQVPKEADVFRIAVLGDSFTFATSMHYDDAFPHKLERLLNQNQGPLRAEVINYGVPGYSTYHEAALLPETIAAGADLVILQITLNDPQLKPYLPTGITGLNEFGPYQTPPEWQRFLRFWSVLDFALQRRHNRQTTERYIDYYFQLYQRPQEWREFQQAFNKIGRIARRREVPVAAVLFPLFGLPLDQSYPFHPLHAKIRRLSEDNQLPFLDLFEIYAGIPLDRLQVIPSDDFHPNEIGHRMAAEAIYQWLADEQLVPAELLIRKRYGRRLNTDCRQNEPLY